MFFCDFPEQTLELEAGSMRLRHGGEGPPLLLLHGNPQTHFMWHAVAPLLADRFTLVCPDLRGYGRSFKPPATADHSPYSKREMARDMVALMQQLGYDRFAVAGHDRGGRVAHRLTLDHNERVTHLAVLDIVPTLEHFERADMDFAMGYYHWFWFAQPHPFPENVISAAPEQWFGAHTTREPKDSGFFSRQALEDYLACVRDPQMIRGMCEDYRAAASIDLEHDRRSREIGERIQCPLLVLWGSAGKIGKWYDPTAIWRSYANGSLSAAPVTSGHYLAEEAPDAVAAALREFLQ
ncbi:MAG: alpha/beta hydrolase [Gammaproteobacteria bacterium]|nr:alpha/beta hydrolase [Gammaproteobacteria bacterium]